MLREETKQGFKRVEETIRSTHEDLKGVIKDVHKDLKSSITAMHGNLKGSIESMHGDMNKHFLAFSAFSRAFEACSSL